MKKMQNPELTNVEKLYQEYIPGFHLATYWHFDKEFLSSDLKKVKKLASYIKDPKKIAAHAFMPLIGNTVVERRISRKNTYHYYKNMLAKHQDDEEIASVCRAQVESFESKGVKKERSLAYASHLDSHIYSYYATILRALYEKAIENTPLENEILAYRKIRNLARNGVRSEFPSTTAAYDVIDAVKKFQHNCYALSFDLEHFFDTIEHEHLKQEWSALLGVDRLPADHFNIFKSLTRFCYIERKEVEDTLNLYNRQARSEGKKTESLHSLFENARIFRNFRKIYPKLYPDHPNFHQNPGLFKNGMSSHGIPQGIGISTLLSNIYMLPFDREISAFVNQHGGLYRRYCDDIMIIIPHDSELKDETISLLKRAVSQRGDSLKLHPIHEWDRNSKSQCFDFQDKEKLANKPLQYLGITYDGVSVRLRQSSVCKFQRKQKKAVSAMAIALTRMLKKRYLNNQSVRCISSADLHLRRTSLYERYTFRGARNFYTYAKTAATMFDSPNILAQMHSHNKMLSKVIEEAEQNLRHNLAAFLKRMHQKKLDDKRIIKELEATIKLSKENRQNQQDTASTDLQ